MENMPLKRSQVDLNKNLWIQAYNNQQYCEPSLVDFVPLLSQKTCLLVEVPVFVVSTCVNSILAIQVQLFFGSTSKLSKKPPLYCSSLRISKILPSKPEVFGEFSLLGPNGGRSAGRTHAQHRESCRPHGREAPRDKKHWEFV